MTSPPIQTKVNSPEVEAVTETVTQTVEQTIAQTVEPQVSSQPSAPQVDEEDIVISVGSKSKPEIEEQEEAIDFDIPNFLRSKK